MFFWYRPTRVVPEQRPLNDDDDDDTYCQPAYKYPTCDAHWTVSFVLPGFPYHYSIDMINIFYLVHQNVKFHARVAKV